MVWCIVESVTGIWCSSFLHSERLRSFLPALPIQTRLYRHATCSPVCTTAKRGVCELRRIHITMISLQTVRMSHGQLHSHTFIDSPALLDRQVASGVTAGNRGPLKKLYSRPPLLYLYLLPLHCCPPFSPFPSSTLPSFSLFLSIPYTQDTNQSSQSKLRTICSTCQVIYLPICMDLVRLLLLDLQYTIWNNFPECLHVITNFQWTILGAIWKHFLFAQYRR